MICPECINETPKLHLPMDEMDGHWYCRRCEKTFDAQGKEIKEPADVTDESGRGTLTGSS